jgi:hypothetical protein
MAAKNKQEILLPETHPFLEAAVLAAEGTSQGAETYGS